MCNTEGGTSTTFRLPERFNSDTPRKVIAELQELPHGDWDCVVLDMGATSSMDSSGIGVLVFLYKELTANGKSFILKRPQRSIYNLLTETGIDRLFDVELSSGLKRGDAELKDLDVQLQMDSEMAGDVCVMSMSGVMNYPAGSSVFKKNMFASMAASNKILLDLKELAFFDSLSVGSALRLSQLLINSGGALRVCRANHVVCGVFQSLGVDAIIPFYETREAALEDWVRWIM